MTPSVSIILPVYNGASTIERAIDSVLAQDFLSWELIIIDDGSTDALSDTIKKYLRDNRISFFQNKKNLGIQKTLNRGLAQAQGVYIARIDSDDVWTDPKKLSKQVAFLEHNPNVVLVGTDAILQDASGKVIGRYVMPKSDTQIRRRILSRNCFLHASVLFRADATKKVGGYSEDSSAYCVEDYDLWLRLGLVGQVSNIDSQISITILQQSLTAKNRLRQAINIFKLLPKYKGKYPNFICGYSVGFCRMIFFWCVWKIPFLRSCIYTIQVIYKKF